MCGSYFNKEAMKKLSVEASAFHVHIYFKKDQEEEAAATIKALLETFPGAVKNPHRVGLVGPHLLENFALTASTKEIKNIYAYLESTNLNLSILLHPRTGNEWTDHIDAAIWIGEPVALNMSFLSAHKPKTHKPPKAA